MAKNLPGIHLPSRKNTENSPPVRLPPPPEVLIPMQMHIGKPATPTVAMGDRVGVGDLIGKAAEGVSSNIHASISGFVSEIVRVTLPGVGETDAVRIISDGEMKLSETVCAPKVRCRDDFISALKQSGIVGLGGAGFPTYVKYSPDQSRIEHVILNAAECEPYITSDSHTLSSGVDDIAAAADAMAEHLGVKSFIIGVESGNRLAADAAKRLKCRIPSLEIKLLRDIYPQGGEKVLIYHTTGRVVPVGKLPIDVGCIVTNISTAAAIGRYLSDGMPLTKRCITVDGDAAADKGNLIVPVGCAVSRVFDHLGGFSKTAEAILYGGVMMGVATAAASPVLKTTNALIALSSRELTNAEPSSCIRCGSCLRHCPFGINPAAVARSAKRGDRESVRRLRIDACMECGCCTYVCPAKLPLAESNRRAKAMLKRRSEEHESRRAREI